MENLDKTLAAIVDKLGALSESAGPAAADPKIALAAKIMASLKEHCP